MQVMRYIDEDKFGLVKGDTYNVTPCRYQTVTLRNSAGRMLRMRGDQFEPVDPHSTDVVYIGNNCDELNLTHGKTYTVSKFGENDYLFRNDLRETIFISKKLFESVGVTPETVEPTSKVMTFISSSSDLYGLTRGKNYNVSENTEHLYLVRNNLGKLVEVGRQLFVEPGRYRDTQVHRSGAQQLVQERSNGTYDQISDDAKKIMGILGNDDNFTYFYSQIANKLARMKHGYSVEDSILDIAGYAELELEKLRTLSASE